MSIAITIQKPNSNYSTAALCRAHRIMQLLEVISKGLGQVQARQLVYITAKYKPLPPIQYRGIHPGCPHGDE